ncbi:threonine synthase [Natronocalculus amylovorans]|uniref:Pyridoxal-phosphate dependent enzyme n=1 Tax=Natronocalculus amylovorans TaxID=2917812 RepID=A0AAE3K6L9_9EURY|nr:pyridoxal-phosphate dependent enzyme [Natronocalculus amylovorans]MCL9815367.1 pyridoxal-phosphate dependent enzyme [Natronocalculus amylovorans]
METTPAFTGLQCTGCTETYGVETYDRCPSCGAPLDPTYDYDAVDTAAISEADPRNGVWAFDAVLPFTAAAAISGAEGATPVVETTRLANELTVDSVYIKDEGRNPTGSATDRGMSVAATAVKRHASDADIEPIALPSTGNSGQSAAAYLGGLDLRSYAFVPSRSAFSNKAMINVHGGEMRVVGGRYADAEDAVDQQLKTEYYPLQEFRTPYRHEGAKTIAYELFADFAGELPSHVFIPASTGEFVVGIQKGFSELQTLGLITETPKLIAVQPTGCSPLVAAVERGLETPEPWAVPDTICGELEVPKPAGGALALEALAASGGTALHVDDSDILSSAVTIAKHEVIEAGAGGGAAAAGAWTYAEEHGFDGGETILLLNTESGLKTPDILRSHLMGQGI